MGIIELSVYYVDPCRRAIDEYERKINNSRENCEA